MLNQKGHIYLGQMKPNGKISGFCITFIGHTKIIDVGWYKNSLMWGNWMSLYADDLTKPIISGWYEDGQRVGNMKPDKDYKLFNIR